MPVGYLLELEYQRAGSLDGTAMVKGSVGFCFLDRGEWRSLTAATDSVDSNSRAYWASKKWTGVKCSLAIGKKTVQMQARRLEIEKVNKLLDSPLSYLDNPNMRRCGAGSNPSRAAIGSVAASFPIMMEG